MLNETFSVIFKHSVAISIAAAAWIYWLDDIIQQLIVKEEGGFLWHRHQLLESLQLMTPLWRGNWTREEAGKNATPFMALWYAWHPVNTETFMALILVVVVNANDKDYFACNYTLWKMSKLFFSFMDDFLLFKTVKLFVSPRSPHSNRQLILELTRWWRKGLKDASRSWVNGW